MIPDRDQQGAEASQRSSRSYWIRAASALDTLGAIFAQLLSELVVAAEEVAAMARDLTICQWSSSQSILG